MSQKFVEKNASSTINIKNPAFITRIKSQQRRNSTAHKTKWIIGHSHFELSK